MKITSLILKNFKRFTHLSLENIPAEAKLVLLIGANGSGKSSVFDAFEHVNTQMRLQVNWGEYGYYRKEKQKEEDIKIEFDSPKFSWPGSLLPIDKIKGFYGRSSFRQIPQLTKTVLGNAGFDVYGDTDRPRLFIQRDNRFENDVEHITGTILRDIFAPPIPQSKSAPGISNRLILL